MDMMSLDRSIESAVRSSVGTVWKQRVTFVLVTSLALMTSVVAVLSLGPVYEGTTLLLTGQPVPETSREAATPPGNSAVALTQIAQSSEVLRAALAAVAAAGYQPRGTSLIDQARASLLGLGPASKHSPSPTTTAVEGLRARLRVRSEINSNVLQISFRDPDPVVAARVANAIGKAFADRQLELSSQPGAAEFFRQQQTRFEQERYEAAAALERFAAESRIYAVEEQRDLLLRRLSELEAKISASRGDLLEKQGQRQMLAEALRKLAPVARSPFVSSLVDALGGERPSGSGRQGELRDDRTSDPPLLLVQVYQQSMANLFRMYAEIAGTQELLRQLGQEQAQITAGLEALSRRADEAERLKQAVAQAAYNADLFARRSVEERISAELQASRFASVRFIQEATEAAAPAFPNYRLLLPAAVLASVMLGFGCALFVGRSR
jgi:uncharacterized protein involved in exopolysaccharide biosynthesis